MKSTLKNYPKIGNGKKRYVRYPVQVTEDDLHHFLARDQVKPGQWVAVNVLDNGYQHLPAAIGHNKEEDCKKACDITNELHGFSESEVEFVVAYSMGIL